LRAAELTFQHFRSRYPCSVEVVAPNTRKRAGLELTYRRCLPAAGCSGDDENGRDPDPAHFLACELSGGATWTPRQLERVMACWTKPDALISSMTSLT